MLLAIFGGEHELYFLDSDTISKTLWTQMCPNVQQSLNGFYGKEREVRLEISILELPCFEGIVNTDRHQIS